MKYLLVFPAALLLVGCSVQVDHATENKAQTESLSTFDNSKTTVAVGILEVPESSPTAKHTDSQESATSSITRSQTTVNVVVPESKPKVIMAPPPQAPCPPNRMIQVAGNKNTVILGDVHLHHHEHKHYHQAPKPHPVRINADFRRPYSTNIFGGRGRWSTVVKFDAMPFQPGDGATVFVQSRFAQDRVMATAIKRDA